MMGVRRGESWWLEHLRKHSPVTASEACVDGSIGYGTDNGGLCNLTVW